MITSGGNRNPAKLDRGTGGWEWRRRINTAWPSQSSVYATVPSYHTADGHSGVTQQSGGGWAIS